MVQFVVHEVKKEKASEDTGYRITGGRNSDSGVANAAHAHHVLLLRFWGPFEPK